MMRKDRIFRGTARANTYERCRLPVQAGGYDLCPRMYGNPPSCPRWTDDPTSTSRASWTQRSMHSDGAYPARPLLLFGAGHFSSGLGRRSGSRQRDVMDPANLKGVWMQGSMILRLVSTNTARGQYLITTSILYKVWYGERCG